MAFDEVISLRGEIRSSTARDADVLLMFYERVAVFAQTTDVRLSGGLLRVNCVYASRSLGDVSVTACSIRVVKDGLGRDWTTTWWQVARAWGTAQLTVGYALGTRLVHERITTVAKADVGVTAGAITGGVDASAGRISQDMLHVAFLFAN